MQVNIIRTYHTRYQFACKSHAVWIFYPLGCCLCCLSREKSNNGVLLLALPCRGMCGVFFNQHICHVICTCWGCHLSRESTKQQGWGCSSFGSRSPMHPRVLFVSCPFWPVGCSPERSKKTPMPYDMIRTRFAHVSTYIFVLCVYDIPVHNAVDGVRHYTYVEVLY